MVIDVTNLLAPLSEEQPSGPDLSYDSDRQLIEAAFERPVDGGGGDEGEGPDWRGTIALITAQAEKTRDLWLPVYLMRAAAQTGNIDLVVTGAELFAGLLEERWADVHPQLDEYGFIGRKTPCESLTRLVDFLGPLARVPLIEHPRLGRYSGADFDRFHQEGSDAPNFGMFRALLDATPPEELQQIVDRLDALRSAIRRADTVLTINADGDTATNFQPTYELLDKLRRGVAATIPGAPVEVPEVTAVQASGNGGSLSTLAPVANGGESFGGAVNSREDVIRALDAISSYYARHEPASPVPFALRRARDWISLDFLAVLEDIAPGGLDEAKRVLTSGRNTNAAASSEWSDSAPSSTTSDGW